MSTRSKPRRGWRANGFTLIEMIVFITIVSLALAGLVQVLAQSVGRSADPVQPKQAMLVAESMLEEILLKPFSNPAGGYVANCPAACERARFDNVADYGNYASVGVYSLDDLSTPVPGLGAYNVSVGVAPDTISARGNSATGLRVTVDVSVGGLTYSLTGYRFNDD